MNRPRSNLALGIVALLVLACAGAWFIYTLIKAPAEFQSGILALMGSVAAVIWAHNSAKRRDIEARHFTEKRAAYVGLVNTMYDVMVGKKVGKKPITSIQLATKLLDFKKMLLIWASAKVIKEWNKIETRHLSDENDPVTTMLIWDDFLREMRKDLGKNDSKLPRGELVALMLKADEKDSVRGKQLGSTKA